MTRAEIIHLIRGNHWAIAEGELRSAMDALAAMPDSGIADEELHRRRSALRARYGTSLHIGASGAAHRIEPLAYEDEDYEDEEEDDATQIVDGIAVVYLRGVVTKNGDFCTRGTADINKDMHALGAMPNVKGVLFCIDSSGGAVDGTETLANTIYDYRRRYKKPVWVFVDGMAASAAYWIAAGADRIYLSGETASVGSIGTMIEITSFEGAYEQMGVKRVNIYATLSTNKNRAYEEALKGNPEPMRSEFLDKLNAVFLRGVIKGRYARSIVFEELTPDNIPEQLTGKVYFGSDAIAIGLADRIATFDAALTTMYDAFVLGKSEPIAGDDMPDDDKDDPIKDAIKRATTGAGNYPDKNKKDKKATAEVEGLRLTPLKTISQILQNSDQ